MSGNALFARMKAVTKQQASSERAPPAALARTQKGITFAVEPGIKASGKYSYGKTPARFRDERPPETLDEAWRKMGGTVDAKSPAPDGTVEVFTKQNLFVKSVHAAFFDHHPLVLSPDVIWLTIAQGLAHHVDQNAEALRDKFVAHDGKKDLVVERPNFVKGSPDNDWEGVFPEFSAKIKANTAPGTVDIIEADFSTTGPIERVVSHITLMDAVQHYFSYTMACGCGFPSITLSGDVEDWQKIRDKAEALRKFDLDWWLQGLLPALDQFVSAARGQPDLDFWRSLCMINTGTSFPIYEPLTGWVQVFFPYLLKPNRDGEPKKEMVRNDSLANYTESFKKRVNVANFAAEQGKSKRKGMLGEGPPKGCKGGVKIERFPPSMSSAPFTYKDSMTGKKHKMAFFGGLTCLVQNGDGALEPRMGWAVLDSGELL